MAAEILIVDDEDDIRSLTKAILSDEGYKVTEAKDGKDALSMLKNKKFDLIVVDYFMPIMNGRQLAEEIRKNPKTKNLKLVFLTVAQFGQLGEKQLKRLNCLDYLKKPIDNEDFIKSINKILKPMKK